MKMKIALIFILTAACGVFFLSKHGGGQTFSKNTTITHSLTIESNEKYVISDNAELTIIGDLVVKGSIECQNGPLSIAVGGSLVVLGDITCKDTTLSPLSIKISAARDINFGQQAHIEGSGPIALTSDQKLWPNSMNEVEELFRSVIDTHKGFAELGPLTSTSSGIFVTPKSQILYRTFPRSFSLFPVAYADEISPQRRITLSGTWSIDRHNDTAVTPSLSPLLYFVFEGESDIHLQQFTVRGESASDGTDDADQTCSAQGARGNDALRLLIKGYSVTIDGASISLPDGGKGGDAKTTYDCSPGEARGGDGGAHGNFNILASQSIDILDATISPGKGGGGGNAEAYGKGGTRGCPGEHGGNASAYGGNARETDAIVFASGEVSGLEHLAISSIQGAKGGDAKALPGRGGDGNDCKCAAGAGGDGFSEGGAGGDAFRLVTASSSEAATGGNGGAADTIGGAGGTGGNCPLTPSGGMGGKGGDAKATPGTTGYGITGSGNTGEVVHAVGGIGGDGGKGCPAGASGAGGNGTPNGDSGKQGEMQCPK